MSNIRLINAPGVMIRDVSLQGLMATFSLANLSLPCELCSHCAELQFRVIAFEPPEDCLVDKTASEHRLHQVYRDIVPTFPNLKLRAAKGCLFCGFLRSSLLEECRKQGLDMQGKKAWDEIVVSASCHEEFNRKSSFSIYEDQGPLVIKVKVPVYDRGMARHIFYDVALQTSSETALTTRDPLSTENVQNVQKWVRECRMNHAVCRARLSGFSPTRVLDTKDETLRLVTGGTDDCGYAALSYCWGSKSNQGDPFTTTKSNLASRLSGFSLGDLPSTLRDAVRTVRALGIRYIWIDALCIIQDDPDDWSEESSRMGQIYSNSCLTIAATTSESSFDGFLQYRDPSYKTTLRFVFKEVQSYRPGALIKKSGLVHFRYPLETSVEGFLSKCRWEDRGWTLQEKLLSTRTLFFTRDVVYYECATTQRVEVPGYSFPKRIEFPALLADSHTMAESERSKKQKYYLSRWYEVVTTYTQRKLTKSNDKLPALEGLASELNRVLDDTYIYGLWRADLHRGLVWSVGSGNSWKLPRNGYRAPTWSWACRDGPVYWDASTYESGWKSLIQVNDIHLHRKCHCCNQIIGAQLDLTGEVAPLKDILEAHFQSVDDEIDQWDALSLPDMLSSFDDELGKFAFDKKEDEVISVGDVQMLLMTERAEPANIQALLIQSLHSGSCFERVGCFIQNETIEDSLGDWAEDFGPLRQYFKSERLVLA